MRKSSFNTFHDYSTDEVVYELRLATSAFDDEHPQHIFRWLLSFACKFAVEHARKRDPRKASEIEALAAKHGVRI